MLVETQIQNNVPLKILCKQ